MFSTTWRKICGLAAGGGVVGLLITLKAHAYDTNSVGVIRLGRAAVTVFRIGCHYKFNLYASPCNHNSKEFEELKSKVHREAAEMLLALCEANQGVYVKVGQHVGALDYLVPPEYVDVMKVLHSHAPKSSFPSVYEVLKQDLKAEPCEIFDSIEEEPLGAASLAQVHRAVLKKGHKEVAVKVQHPLVLRNSIVDMKTMEYLVKIVSIMFEDFNFQWLVDEMKVNLPKELDFRQEAENAKRIRELMNEFKWLKVPDIEEDLTTRRVLTMSFVEGSHITDLDYINEKNINRIGISSKLGELYSNMIFKHGFVHSDPHPGNIMVCRKENEDDYKVILLDHGLYANLSKEFRWHYSKLWLSILNRDHKGMKTASEKLGIGSLYPLLACMVTGRTWDSINGGIEKITYSPREKAEFQANLPNFLPKVGEVLATVNRQMLLILKTNDLLRGIEHALGTDKRQPSFLMMSRYCLENICEERLHHCRTVMQRVTVHVWKQWAFLKLNIYYMYLNVRSIFSVS